MIRYICREDDIGPASVGGPVRTRYVTFTDAVEFEGWVTAKEQWLIRTIIACEVVLDKEGDRERETVRSVRWPTVP